MIHTAPCRINTASQRWAKRNGACLAGRRRLGRKTIFEYFTTCHNMEDMRWIARRLKPGDPTLVEQYLHQLTRAGAWVKNGWRNKFAHRKALWLVMEAYDVQWPVDTLR